MTDLETIQRVLSLIEPHPGEWSTARKNGRLFLVLPSSAIAARRALDLFQPQRFKAKAMMTALRAAAQMKLHHHILPQIKHPGREPFLESLFPDAIPGTCGILLGSPEHRVRRAIASYQTERDWEVAKIAFGKEGWDVIRGEATALQSLPPDMPGIPSVNGIHQVSDASLLRLPYVQGQVLHPSEAKDAIALLKAWLLNAEKRAISEFPEWAAIEAALSPSLAGRRMLERLADLQLRPAVRHGDFARWNLIRQNDGSLISLDWEWGAASGMPGLDLVHFFSQDARLVQRLPPREVIQGTEQWLQQPGCKEYLEKSGWNGNARLAILASIAFTVGTKQQANEDILTALLE